MRRLLGIAFLTFALLQLGFRGVQRVRHDVPLWDFASVYSATRTWIHGGNPYDAFDVISTWKETGLFSNRDVSYFATVYPPSSLLLVLPFAPLPAAAALTAWLAITLALLVLQFWALADMAQLRASDDRSLLLFGAALAAAPLQFGILSGQLSIPAISLCILAFWASSRNGKGEILAGVLLGLACALKPQVAGPFAIYYLLLRRVRLASTAILTGGAILGIAILAMHLSQVAWLAGWTQSMAATTQRGAVNDYNWGAPFRDEIVDLKMLMVGAQISPMLMRILILAIVGLVLAVFVRAYAPPSDRRSELLALAGVGAISLLPVYHRVYDVALLATALAWALTEIDFGPERRRYAIGTLIAMLVFLVPFDIIKSVGNRLPQVRAVSGTWWWHVFVVPHYAWGLFALTIALIVAAKRQSALSGQRRDSGAPEPESDLSSKVEAVQPVLKIER